MNGQPASLCASLRAAARRVLPCLGWGRLALAGASVLFLLCPLPGWVTENPWLNIIGPVLGLLEFLGALVIALPTLLGVMYLERARLGRCITLVTGRSGSRPGAWS